MAVVSKFKIKSVTKCHCGSRWFDLFVFLFSCCVSESLTFIWREFWRLQTTCQTFCAKYKCETGGETCLLCSVNKLYKFSRGCVITESESGGIFSGKRSWKFTIFMQLWNRGWTRWGPFCKRSLHLNLYLRYVIGDWETLDCADLKLAWWFIASTHVEVSGSIWSQKR